MSDKSGTLANRDFFEFVKSIGESKSKQEEDQIISEEVIYLKKKITESNVPRKKMKEMLARAVYIEMLGMCDFFRYCIDFRSSFTLVSFAFLFF